MSIYQCQKCNFSTPNKYNYSQHLKTKKHLSLIKLNAPENEQNEQKNEQNEQENEQNEQKKCILQLKRTKRMHFLLLI